jgi:chemotaxis protein CheX
VKAEYANIFISSAVDVFQKEARIHVARKELVRRESPVPSLPVAIILGITGFLRGQVVYSMDDNFAFKLAQAMLPNKLPADVKRLTNSAISEIANIITGQASIALAGEDQQLGLTPPAVLAGSGFSFDFLSVPTISIGFLSEIGTLEINIALSEGMRR